MSAVVLRAGFAVGILVAFLGACCKVTWKTGVLTEFRGCLLQVGPAK